MGLNSKGKKSGRPEIQTEIPDAGRFDATDSLESVVSESKEKLAGEPPPPSKRNKTDGRIKKDGRGRPTREEAEAEAAREEAERRAQAEQVAADLSPALEFGVALPFEYAVEKTGYKGWALNSEQKNALARQVDAVLKRYLPAIPSEHQALGTLCTSLIFLGIGKTFEYRRWVEEIRVTPAAPSETQGENVGTVSDGR